MLILPLLPVGTGVPPSLPRWSGFTLRSNGGSWCLGIQNGKSASCGKIQAHPLPQVSSIAGPFHSLVRRSFYLTRGQVIAPFRGWIENFFKKCNRGLEGKWNKIWPLKSIREICQSSLFCKRNCSRSLLNGITIFATSFPKKFHTSFYTFYN